MRIRSLHLKDFRNFRGEHRIDFVDPLTGAPHPVSALAGPNGSGKTTVLDCIEGLLRMAVTRGDKPGLGPYADVVQDAWKGGYIRLEIECAPAETGEAAPLRLSLAAGDISDLPTDWEIKWGECHGRFRHAANDDWSFRDSGVARLLAEQASNGASVEVHGGLTYFPSSRRFVLEDRVAIEAPQRNHTWLDRVEDTTGWGGNLERYWVWLNYLDLEANREPGASLAPFARQMEKLLGPGRRILVKEGRVRITPPGNGREPVPLSALPSGEKQVLLLLGELARRSRPGMVVLIDEPELSLHPALQTALVGYLRRFGREHDSQVILATHSAEIVRALRSATLFLGSSLSPEPRELEEAAA